MNEGVARSAASRGSRALNGFQRLALLNVVVTLALIALGGAVRATDSGLACPTWPGCFSGGDFLPALQVNVWLEHSHRLVAGAVGLLIAAQLGWALLRYRTRPDVVWPAVAALVAVLVQAALGALVVLQLLRAELVTAHLGMGMVVLASLLTLTVTASSRPGAPGRVPRDSAHGRLARTSAAVSALLLAQILIGGHVTGIAAGLAFVGEGFPFLGVASFSPLQTEQQVFNAAHRVVAVALVVAVAVLVRQARTSGASGWTARLPRVVAGLLGLQIALGLANLWSGLSSLAVIPHLTVASWLWAAMVVQTLLARRVGSSGQGQTERSGPAAREARPLATSP